MNYIKILKHEKTQWRRNRYKKNLLIQQHFEKSTSTLSKRNNTNIVFKIYYAPIEVYFLATPTLFAWQGEENKIQLEPEICVVKWNEKDE